jgi:quinol monooxygenase YgiN
MEKTTPVTAIMSFRLLPGFQETWTQVWRELRDAGLSDPNCREFRLLSDRHDEAHFIVLTEWERATDLDAFVREAGVMWLTRCMNCTREPPAYSLFEAILPDADKAVSEQLRQLIPTDQR